jgi:hypothetical protein
MMMAIYTWEEIRQRADHREYEANYHDGEDLSKQLY